MSEPIPNPGKNLVIEIAGDRYARFPIKTDLITPLKTNPANMIKKYVANFVKAGDVVFVSEKVVAIMQGRAFPIDQIKPSRLAIWLSQHVTKNPAGIGLAIPQTMQLAIDEVGRIRILLAALIAAITKPLGLKGMFYRVAGDQARAVDGPVPYAIPPYNSYASKGPSQPNHVARSISRAVNCPVAIVDANDLGAKILGSSQNVNKKIMLQALRDNPLGQSAECTPIGILRKL